MNDNKVIDFDAWRKERAEQTEPPQPVIFRVGGKDYELPAEPPAIVALDVVRLKKSIGEDAEVSTDTLINLGIAMFGEEQFREILTVNRIGGAEMGDLLIQAFRAWSTDDDEPVPNRKTRRARKRST